METPTWYKSTEDNVIGLLRIAETNLFCKETSSVPRKNLGSIKSDRDITETYMQRRCIIRQPRAVLKVDVLMSHRILNVPKYCFMLVRILVCL